jgi:hypothetical protein
MSKEIELHITIDKNGKVTVTPKGTQGKECLDLMKFLDKIKGFEVSETVPNADMKKNQTIQNSELENYLSSDNSGAD